MTCELFDEMQEEKKSRATFTVVNYVFVFFLRHFPMYNSIGWRLSSAPADCMWLWQCRTLSMSILSAFWSMLPRWINPAAPVPWSLMMMTWHVVASEEPMQLITESPGWLTAVSCCPTYMRPSFGSSVGRDSHCRSVLLLSLTFGLGCPSGSQCKKSWDCLCKCEELFKKSSRESGKPDTLLLKPGGINNGMMIPK